MFPVFMSIYINSEKGLEEIKGQIPLHHILTSTWKSTGHS